MSDPLLKVRNLKVKFPVLGGVFRHKVNEVRAVDGVSFDLLHGETLGMVGESGCGKSTLAKAICNLLYETAPGVEIEGDIHFNDGENMVNLLELSRKNMKPFRGEIQMIFQDPFSSLNPRMTVEEIVGRPLKIHTGMTTKDRRLEVGRLLERVGLQPAYATRYPHEFSGGQRQRIGIARALAVKPKLIIADEPVSALDVSVQSQVINLMQDLQEEFQLTYLFVAHDLSVVKHISDRIAVMYLGDLVELGEADTVYDSPKHPYTQVLLSAVPQPEPRRTREKRTMLKGEIPSPLNKPRGCAFHTRCPIAKPSCEAAKPDLQKKETGQVAACPLTE